MSAPNEMRKFISIMYGKKPDKVEVVIEEKKDYSMRNMLGKMRKINENVQSEIGTDIDKEEEIKKLENYLGNGSVNVEVKKFAVYPNAIFMSGLVNDVIRFKYEIVEDKPPVEAEVTFVDGYESTNPEDNEIIKRLFLYDNEFKKYWRNSKF